MDGAEGAGSQGGRWQFPLLVVAGLALLSVGFVVLFRGADRVPGQITPAGAVIELRDYVEAGDFEAAQTRLCGDFDPEAQSPAAEVVAFFQGHDVELADSREPGDVPSNRDIDERDDATTAVIARPGGDADGPPQRWVVHLQRDPGGSGPMVDRSLRWRVCAVEPDAAAAPEQ